MANEQSSPRKRRRSSTTTTTAAATNDNPRTTPATFTTLPREIRDQIYAHALHSQNPIPIFRNGPVRYTDPIPHWGRKIDPHATSTALKELAFNLLLTSRTTHTEAAPIFYGTNTFSFEGSHDWTREVAWLRGIGPRNRGLLTSVSLALEPRVVYQFADGSRKGEVNEFMPRGAHRRNELLVNPDGDGAEWEDGEVEDIDPEWEEIFRLLGEKGGDAEEGGRGSEGVTVRVVNLDFGIPGAFEFPDEPSNDEAWFSMDIPNVFEAWRARHSASSGGKAKRELDIIWVNFPSTDDDTEHLDDLYERLEEVGWEIIDREATPGVKAVTAEEEQEKDQFTMRLKPLPAGEPIKASRPNPFAMAHGPMEDDDRDLRGVDDDDEEAEGDD